MKNNVKPIPNGYPQVIPYLIIDGADKAIEYYKKVFGAKVNGRMAMGNNKVGNAEIQIGDSRIMLVDVFPESEHKDPKSIGDSPIALCIYVDDVDDVFKKAIDAGGKVDIKGEVDDMFWGDRSGTVIDPFGHRWMIMTHIEDVSYAEMQERFNKRMNEGKMAEAGHK
ncbi:MAG: VOC family protein [bacterium]